MEKWRIRKLKKYKNEKMLNLDLLMILYIIWSSKVLNKYGKVYCFWKSKRWNW